MPIAKELRLSPERLAELDAAHKRTAHVRDKDWEWELVFRKPTHAEWKRFRAMVNSDQKSEAAEHLARVCVVYPTREQFDALLEEYPALGDASNDALCELAGITADKSAKL